MGSKRLTPMRVGKMTSKCLLLLLLLYALCSIKIYKRKYYLMKTDIQNISYIYI